MSSYWNVIWNHANDARSAIFFDRSPKIRSLMSYLSLLNSLSCFEAGLQINLAGVNSSATETFRAIAAAQLIY
jgi:hypothetical protein